MVTVSGSEYREAELPRLYTRLAPHFALVVLCAAILIFATAPFLYLRAIRTPFLGAFVGHSLVIQNTVPVQTGGWEMALPQSFGYQIAALDKIPISSVHHLNGLLALRAPGDSVQVTLAGPPGIEKISVQLSTLSPQKQIQYFFAPYLAGLIFLVCGLYVYLVRRDVPVALAFCIFSASGAIVLAAWFDIYTTNWLTPAWVVALALVGGALIHLAMLFPKKLSVVQRKPYWFGLGYVTAAALGLFALPTLYDVEQFTAYLMPWRLIIWFDVIVTAIFLLLNGLRSMRSDSPVVRGQVRMIFWGGLVAFIPPASAAAISMLSQLPLSPIYSVSLVFFPVTISYALSRNSLLRPGYFIRRGVMYSFLAAGIVIAYALLMAGLTLVLKSLFGVIGLKVDTNPLLIGLVVFIIALGLDPARNYLKSVIDSYFFRGRRVYQDVEQSFNRELTQRIEMPEILSLVRRTIDSTIAATPIHIYLFDPINGRYSATSLNESGSVNESPSSDLWFQLSSPLVAELSDERRALLIADLANLPSKLKTEAPRLALLSCVVFVPMPGCSRLTGWLGLGKRRSGEVYTPSDLVFLETLAGQAALALERAQAVNDLQRHVREMNVLSRVAQGVSFSVAFDDLLELICAQTNQIIPARDFRLILLDESTDVISYVFYLENDERMHGKENHPLPPGRGLEHEVIQAQRAIFTDDYERECRSRGMITNAPGVFAWMGVPLNAGAQTIGAISIGSRDLKVNYTHEQLNLLQAIADQASGAIVKARALQESERRALQLKRLNEIGLGLTSTLDLKPLLIQILTSATEILECQAGSLFLVDNQTDELVFEVVLGPVASNLTGRRLPKGAGLVGQAVQTGRAIIANDAKRRKEWFEKPDEQTGFETHDLLVVPMRIHDRVIGVIEVINKTSGAPFTNADQELLTAFTSQATIAIENARLYTMTDQALAARVEELSVMQRIDRELNAGLDIERAMRLTLDWAMRQSRADAGLVGAVENGNVRVMVAQGYSQEIEAFNDLETMPTNLMARIRPIQDAIEKGLPGHYVLEPSSDIEADRLLPLARRQIVIPIRRESYTIGVLMLECIRPEALPEELLAFLTRLSDHAAIAIANAQLYEEVREANLAKSRFVSFVAHELKNPMASIKGYTELVSSGMAGPVNEMQGSFLQTVKSNVDRMNTIVSDLNDLTKIQTGNLSLEFRAVNFTEVLEEVIRSIKRQIDDKKQTIVQKLEPTLPHLWGDPSRLTQVLTNLVSNAHKYTPESKSITIGADHGMGDAAEGDTPMVHIWVADEGIGISEDDQKKIFQQYFRTDNAKEMASGTGLGLSITRSLVELHGGKIWFESHLDMGTTFHILIPIADA